MTRCLKCGSTFAPHARFCSVCGAESAPPAPQSVGAAQNGANPNVTQGFSRTSTFNGADLGTTTAFTAQGNQYAPNPDAENKKRMAIAIGGGTALVIIAGLIFGFSSGLLGAKKPNTGGAAVLSAPPAQTVQAPLLTAPAPSTANAPVVSAPPAKTNPMPADVIDYLRWLKTFEAGRLALESKSEAQMLLVVQELIKVGMVGTKSMGLLEGDSEEASRDAKNAGPTIDTRATNAVIADWNTAAGIFQQKSPPNACATLASNYNGGLTSSVKGMTEILGAGVRAVESINAAGGEKTGDASEVLSFLTDQKNNATMSKNIEGFFTASDQSLDAVRSQYTNIPPDIDKGQFSIKSGNAGGINIPIPGLGM
ncbi:MAG: hypothetical protein H8F28_27615 [Fibrella sp.]|nr:hypothetical protein [Armatimonadota bacterium]